MTLDQKVDFLIAQMADIKVMLNAVLGTADGDEVDDELPPINYDGLNG